MITPHHWRRIIDVAVAQAMDGDPRARDWLARVLGTDNSGSATKLSDDEAELSGFRDLCREILRDERRLDPED